MKIAWFVEKEGHLFDCEGELPLVGADVYFHDMTPDRGPGTRTRYTVVSACHKITKSAHAIEGMQFKSRDPEERFAEADELLKYWGDVVSLDTLGRKFICARQEGEVTLRVHTKDVP